MLKAVVLLKRKQGLTPEQFIHHYENNHVPLVRRLLPSIGRYVRNYLSDTSLSAARQAGGADSPRPYFDVITELWFEDRAAYDRFITALNDPDTSRRLQEDEERFLDRTVVQTFSVAEYESASPSR
jgi:uncharacterized protein (TIGR02118 family)